MRPPGEPLLSPDGRYFWDGAEWRPASELPPVASAGPGQPPAQYPAQPPQYAAPTTAPPQMYAQPQPMYAQPQPMYAQPQPMYAQPQPMYAQPVATMMVAAQRNGIGTAAGVLGIVAAILMFVPYADYGAIGLGVLAVIFGGVGISRAGRLGGAGKGMAITGLVLGLIAVIVSIIFIIAVYAYINSVRLNG